jgi:hypothetical protein
MEIRTMNILGKEFIMELMPDGWVICERWLDGALSVIDNQFASKKEASNKLQHLCDFLTQDCQTLGISPEQYWQKCNEVIIAQLIHQIH